MSSALFADERSDKPLDVEAVHGIVAVHVAVIDVTRRIRGRVGRWIDQREDETTFHPPEIDNRDFQANETILSGEIGGSGIEDNCLVIVRGASNDSFAMLDGFTISRAASHAVWNYYLASPQLRNLRIMDCQSSGSGAGMLNEEDSRPFVAFSTFINCQASSGGAVYNSNSSPIFEDCTFSENATTGFGAAGGAIRSTGTSVLTLRGCVLSGNTSAGDGGAISNEGQMLRLITSVLTANQAGDNPYIWRWGGALSNFADATIVDCLFAGNSTTGQGGAVYNGAQYGQLTVTNSAFSGNTSGTYGGGMYCFQGDPRLTNCTFTANQAAYAGGGGGLYRDYGDPILTNGILWGNTANGIADEAAQSTGSGSIFLVDYSCIQGLDTLAARTGNIGTNPLFVDADGADDIIGTADDDLRLQATSPCADAALNASVPADSQDADADADLTEPTPDLALAPRILNNPAVVGPAPCGPAAVDMGAHEFRADCDDDEMWDDEQIAQDPALDANGDGILDECQSPPVYDCNNNGIEDECDIAGGTARDCYPSGGDGVPDECQIVDCNGNCVPDSSDIGPSGSEDCNENGVPDECEAQQTGFWTNAEDFAQGTLSNLNTATSGQLERNPIGETKPLPYLGVAASGRGTIVRIRTEDEPSPGTGHAPTANRGLDRPFMGW